MVRCLLKCYTDTRLNLFQFTLEPHASRPFEIDNPDVRQLREQVGLSQSEFAQMMRVSVKTLQNWEQHRRNPTGPAAALLKIVSTSPELAMRSLHA